ncbi:MAG: aspartate/tyrosine/aromatic aminotransferase [Acidobacteria bacterium]|nr:aspartate/tyrosine/aromatic aminotransferase [Acidobacteriota bacterium]
MQHSPFAHIEQAPPDPIIGLTEAFNNDTNPAKVNLGVGVYQDANGKVPILNVVKEAQKRWQEQEATKTYFGIDGVPAYIKEVQKLLLGEESQVLAEGRAVTVQGLGGTGSLKVGADFLKRFFPEAQVWISKPSWENHKMLFEAAGFKVNSYPYYDPETHGLDFNGMLETLKTLPAGSIVVLHACCHNPTGVDLNNDQWLLVLDVVKQGKLIPFLDFAYQGFGDSLDADAFAVRTFAEAGIPCLIANSFSKSFALYRERVGALTILTTSAEESKRVLSQVKRVIRTNYSSPASHGAQLVALVLADKELRQQWEAELTEMRERIQQMRGKFVEMLREKGVEQDFSFIQAQRGMFSYSGLSPDAVKTLREKNSLYIVGSGRICLAAMNDNNIGGICAAIAEVV